MDYWTPHDLRRTFSTRLGDLGVAPHIIEKLLNHTPERIEVTKRWAEALARIVSGRGA